MEFQAMSMNLNAGAMVQRPLRQPPRSAAQAPAKQKDIQLSPLGRVGKVAFSPVSAATAGIGGGFKATFLTALAAGGLAKTAHPISAGLVVLGGFVGVPVYAAGKAIGRFISNLKAGITGHTPAKS
jgi:hypothetical protein